MKAGQEVIAVFLGRHDGGWKQDGSTEGGEQYAFEGLPIKLIYGLNVGAEGEREHAYRNC